jgi:hypothetical protein
MLCIGNVQIPAAAQRATSCLADAHMLLHSVQCTHVHNSCTLDCRLHKLPPVEVARHDVCVHLRQGNMAYLHSAATTNDQRFKGCGWLRDKSCLVMWFCALFAARLVARCWMLLLWRSHTAWSAS